jgi:dual specificity phosphatase 12
MRDANITHVLSVLGLDIEKKLLEDYKHLQIEVDDVEDENLLQHFKATNAFIEEGLNAGGGVYVHWCVHRTSALRALGRID